MCVLCWVVFFFARPLFRLLLVVSPPVGLLRRRRPSRLFFRRGTNLRRPRLVCGRANIFLRHTKG